MQYACYDQLNFASPMDNTNVVLSLHDSSFPLAQCTRLKASEPFRFVTKFVVDQTCCELEDTFDTMHDLVEIPFEGSCDVFMHEESLSLCFEGVLLNPIDH